MLSGKASITNDADCLITGAEKAILTTNGIGPTSSRISLTNHGTIDGVIDCNATQGDVTDTVINKGTITEHVELGAGDDIFNGVGGRGSKSTVKPAMTC